MASQLPIFEIYNTHGPLDEQTYLRPFLLSLKIQYGCHDIHFDFFSRYFVRTTSPEPKVIETEFST